MWTVYQNPSDYPGSWVARVWTVSAGGPPVPGPVVVASSLDAVRDALPPGLYRVPAAPGDDPAIVESWL